jgi:hypothetical protein
MDPAAKFDHACFSGMIFGDHGTQRRRGTVSDDAFENSGCTFVQAECSYHHIRLQRDAFRVDQNPVAMELQASAAGGQQFHPSLAGCVQQVSVKLNPAKSY